MLIFVQFTWLIITMFSDIFMPCDDSEIFNGQSMSPLALFEAVVKENASGLNIVSTNTVCSLPVIRLLSHTN